jgi:hypothetical protein
MHNCYYFIVCLLICLISMFFIKLVAVER